MDKVYSYTAKNRNDSAVKGQVIAENSDHAFEVAVKLGLTPIEIKLDVSSTLSLAKDFSLNELGRLYITMGKRMRNSGNFAGGIKASIEFIKDIRIKSSLSMVYYAIMDGQKISQALRLAGFPNRHCSAIEAMEESGNISDTLISLGQECQRENDLKKRISKLTRMPKFFFFIVIVMVYGAFGFMIHGILGKLSEMVGGLDQMPSYTQVFYKFSVLFSENLMISSIAYFSAIAGLIYFAKSSLAKRLLYKIPVANQLSERSDMASLWGSFALLYDAGINLPQASEMIAKAAEREESTTSFKMLASNLRSGFTLAESVKRSDFPDYVVSAISAGESQQGNMGESMKDLSLELQEDVMMLMSRIEDSTNIGITLAMAATVVFFFMITYYPMLSTMLSQL